ncbi:MAG: alpha/beta hydrolase [Chloroflexi bacterium]|nr:alpha/beta hydrolase [Chloroflexota bacterium]
MYPVRVLEARERWTRSGVRLRRVAARRGRWSWLLVPGGPGLGSESLVGLAQAAGLPGSVWLVDLPGDGSNRDVAGVPSEPYAHWPGCLAEAAEGLDAPVMIGHSTGGMFLLSVPDLQHHLVGLALVSSAPHAGWRATFARWAATHPIPGVDEAADAYARNPNDETLRALTLAAAPWNFTPGGLTRGRALLERLTYCQDAVAWADTHFDETYRSRWTPATQPTLIVSGAQDHVVDQQLWETEAAFRQPHILRRTIADAGHLPWIEQPRAVRAAFAELVELLARRAG